MSHLTVVDLEVHDLDALAVAARRTGLEFADEETYRWYGASMGDYPLPAGFAVEDLGRCQHVLRLPATHPAAGKAYEIGVVARRDGRPGYLLLWDFWMGGYGLEAVAGKDCARLRQEYAAEVTRREAALEGFFVQEERGADGTLRLQLTR